MDKPICAISDCETKVLAKGYCVKHYARWNKYGDPLYVTPRPQKQPCSIEECDRTAIAKSFCTLHYARFKKYGDPYYVPPRVERKSCGVEECDRKADAHGYCRMHLHRFTTTGDPRGFARRFKDKPECTIPGCHLEGNNFGFGWCYKHYRRYHRHGDPFATSRIVGDDMARFKSYVTIGEPDECWNWEGSVDDAGYGHFFLKGRVRGAYVASRILLEGEDSDGYDVDHLCRNPTCVNPRHLDVVTHQENIIRGTAPAAVNHEKTHCHIGHPFDEENTYYNPDGNSRQCRECRRAANLRYEQSGRRKRKTAA